MTTAERYLFHMVHEGEFQDREAAIRLEKEEAECRRVASLPAYHPERVRERLREAEKRLEARYGYDNYIGLSVFGIHLDGGYSAETLEIIIAEWRQALVGAGV